MKRLHLWIAILLLVGLIGCGESFYDDQKPSGAIDHIGHQDAATDLTWAIAQHKFEHVGLAGCLPSRLYPGRENSAEEIERLNQVIFDLRKQGKELVFGFPLISPTFHDDPVARLAEYIDKGQAYGAALDPTPDEDWFSPKMLRFFEACELARCPLILHVDKSRIGDLERIASDYPHLILIVPQLASLHDDIPRLRSLLWRYHTIYLGLGFGPEDVLEKKIGEMSENIPEIVDFIEEHRERICFAPETNLTEEPYRNSSLAEGQIRFLRRFIEKDKAELNVKTRGGKFIRKTFPGLNLNQQLLRYIYALNFLRAVSNERPGVALANLDRLVTDLPKDATWDGKGKRAVILAVFTGYGNLIGGISSPHLRDVFEGRIVNLSDAGGVDAPVELVSYRNAAELAKRAIRADKPLKVKRFDDADKFVDYLVKHPNALGIGTFDQADFRLRVVSIDGESPVIPYIKYCASKGAGTVLNYFGTYPLLAPLSMADDVDVPTFDPHQLRRFALAGPVRIGRFDAGSNARVAAVRPTIDIAPLLREAGITALAIDGPITEDCSDDSCSDARFFSGLLGTRMEGYIATDPQSVAKIFAPHHVEPIAPGHPLSQSVRGKGMTLVGGMVTPEQLPALLADVKASVDRGDLTAAALWASDSDFESMVNPLLEAGASVVVNLREKRLLPWKVTDRGVIAPGIGAPILPKDQTGRAVLLQLTFYKDRLIEVTPVAVETANAQSRVLVGAEVQETLRPLFAR